MSEAERIIDELITHARALSPLVQPGQGEYHLRSLLKIRDWAYAQQPYQSGDRVELIADLDVSELPGWRPYAALLVAGAKGTVDHIDFNGVWGTWHAFVRFDGTDPGLFGLRMERLQPVERVEVAP